VTLQSFIQNRLIVTWLAIEEKGAGNFANNFIKQAHQWRESDKRKWASQQQ
jgi:hypothetical protein